MKKLNKAWIHKLCTACIILGWINNGTGLSVLLFGETEYPTKPEE